MRQHKYTVGDRVIVRASNANFHVRPGAYTILTAMPVTSQGYQYRAKNAFDNHERVLNEDQLIEG